MSPAASQWYSHMPLADYLDLDLPMLEFVSPEDAVRLGGIIPGYYRFTRGGPAGRDFGGPEIDTRE